VTVRRLRTYLIVTVLVVVGALGGTLASGNEPVLGLDLQGGISIVYAPVGKFTSAGLDEAVNIIQNRVNGLGVAEPDINRQGNTISVDLPGVKDRDKASRIVGQTAELRFRPVLAQLPAENAKAPSTTTTTVAGATTTVAPSTTTTVAPSTTTTTTASDAAAKAAIASCDAAQVTALVAAGTKLPTTSTEDDKRDACVVLPLRKGVGGAVPRLLLGPTKLTGKGVSSSRSQFDQGTGYVVLVDLTSDGLKAFNEMAAAQAGQAPPTDEVAITLDGIIQSSPSFQASSFTGSVQISGSFTPSEASDLATVINYGALPVQLKKLTTTNVSPSLGQDQLDAGVAAGLIGLLLVAAYMIVYYRLLGAVVILGLLMSGVLTYALVVYLGQHIGLALTLAGVTGLIVSIGVTVDSYVVYFERLKDEVRAGRSVRSSVDRAFARSFRTIVAADLVSLIGAGALYFIAIGSVRGFAFFLGVSTLLDLVVSYFFMHPMVSLMARRPALVRMRGLGIGSGLDSPQVTA
jgi:preprotein translocase subunit SecD